ncbi:MAG: hypothetical protein ACFFCW_00465 [Candidatus Hodarchaeota archaeon]
MKSHSFIIFFTALFAAIIATPSYAAVVTPMIGGGQVQAPMIHIDIFYDYDADNMSAIVDTSHGIPELRPLSPGDEFDPNEPWSILSGKAYNFQYGWNPGGFFVLPEGACICIELIGQTPGLETYDGRRTRGSYAPIFGTCGSKILWKWSGAMVHNTYAIPNPIETRCWATYKVYFGDEKSGEPIAGYDDDTVTLEWTVRGGGPEFASNPNPPNYSVPGTATVVLSWSPGIYADKHKVYFGTSPDNLVLITGPQDANSHSLGILELGQTYYWRVDEVNTTEPNEWTGKPWVFMTDYLIVDDMESYDESAGQPGAGIWHTWKDGYGWAVPSPGSAGNGTGSMVDANTVTIHGSFQSMKIDYDNSRTGMNIAGDPIIACYSEVEADIVNLEIDPDWTIGGAKVLDIWFRGDTANAAEQMYVVLSDGTNSATSLYSVHEEGLPNGVPDPNGAQQPDWTPWRIVLQDFADANNMYLTSIDKIYIGFGQRGNTTTPGGSGTVYFDDIRLYPSRCLTGPVAGRPQYDLNDDCVVDFNDLAVFAKEWLNTGIWPRRNQR